MCSLFFLWHRAAAFAFNLDCPICRNPPTVPTLTVCRHQYCLPCLRELVERTASTPEGTLCCLCRHQITTKVNHVLTESAVAITVLHARDVAGEAAGDARQARNYCAVLFCALCSQIASMCSSFSLATSQIASGVGALCSSLAASQIASSVGALCSFSCVLKSNRLRRAVACLKGKWGAMAAFLQPLGMAFKRGAMFVFSNFPGSIWSLFPPLYQSPADVVAIEAATRAQREAEALKRINFSRDLDARTAAARQAQRARTEAARRKRQQRRSRTNVFTCNAYAFVFVVLLFILIGAAVQDVGKSSRVDWDATMRAHQNRLRPSPGADSKEPMPKTPRGGASPSGPWSS